MKPRPGRSSRESGPTLSISRPFDDSAADDGTERDAEAADATPCAEGKPAAVGRDRSGEDRQRERCDDRAAEPLNGAGRDQRLDVRREGGGR